MVDSMSYLSVLVDDEPGHVGHDLSLLELLAHVDLDVRQPHRSHKVGGT